jgi:hypothetical protein
MARGLPGKRWAPKRAGMTARTRELIRTLRRAKARPEKPPVPVEDHTDDLYFTKPGVKAKRKPKVPNPNQLDLFGPDQKGAEHADPHNPGVVIVDEEGDGASFGGVDQSS